MMKEGYYWILHQGIVQEAYYARKAVDRLVSGRTITGVRYLIRGDDLCHGGEMEMSEELLFPP